MPIYEYQCENGHRFEVLQSFSESDLTECRECGAPVRRLISPPAIHFKGKGFHNTDYGKGGGRRSATEGETGSPNGGDAGSAKPAESKLAESKPAASKTGGGEGKGSGDSAKSGSSAPAGKD